MASDEPRKRKRRWGDSSARILGDGETKHVALDAKAKARALQEKIKAQLAAARAKTGKKRPPPTALTAAPAAPQPPIKKAKHYDLDLTVTGPTFKPVSEAPKPKSNPYLAHLQEQSDEDPNNDDTDDRLVRASKPRQRHKEIHFIEPGTFVEIAERKRQKAANAIESGFVSGRKAGVYVQSASMADVYGGGGVILDKDGDRNFSPRAEYGKLSEMPIVMEWWDMELLPSKIKKQIAAEESTLLANKSKRQMRHLGKSDDKADVEISKEVLELQSTVFHQTALSYSKTAALVQHIVPIRTSTEPAKEPTLYLTKKELKRQRKLRRAEKQRELQDMQAAGLIPAPEPRLTLQNFIRVMGDHAYLDPSQMEQKVKEQVEARQRVHMERNDANKLSKEQRAEKRSRKLQEDTSDGVSVAIFYVKDMSHTYHRTVVDLNAQQSYITGGVLECQNPSLAVVICEGGPKAIKKFVRLMTVRMKWQGPDGAAEEEGDGVEGEEDKTETQKFNPDNKCELVWNGMGRKRLFKGFLFQSCETSQQARKVLANKGVGHYWDQVITHASGEGDSFNFKLAEGDEDGRSNDMEL